MQCFITYYEVVIPLPPGTANPRYQAWGLSDRLGLPNCEVVVTNLGEDEMMMRNIMSEHGKVKKELDEEVEQYLEELKSGKHKVKGVDGTFIWCVQGEKEKGKGGVEVKGGHRDWWYGEHKWEWTEEMRRMSERKRRR